MTYKTTSLPKFTAIFTNETHPLFKDLFDRASCEMELFFKGSLYKNITAILSKLSFNSLEYEYIYNWSQVV